MPRRMSFAMTVAQVRAGAKDVTRRLGWEHLQPGDVLEAVEKAMGFKKGQTAPPPICRIRVIKVSRERLDRISSKECAREGFPNMKPREFVAMFCKAMRCEPTDTITRIEFEVIPQFAVSLIGLGGDPPTERTYEAPTAQHAAMLFAADDWGSWQDDPACYQRTLIARRVVPAEQTSDEAMRVNVDVHGMYRAPRGEV